MRLHVLVPHVDEPTAAPASAKRPKTETTVKKAKRGKVQRDESRRTASLTLNNQLHTHHSL